MSENRRKTLSDEMKINIQSGGVGRRKKSRHGGTTVTKLTPEIERQIIQLVNDNCTMTTLDIPEKLDITMHETTVWRWLKKLQFSWKVTRPVLYFEMTQLSNLKGKLLSSGTRL
ncbi:hypothetical protein RF11_02004 [Thelohanellus kitauei]|uniref:Winged helix-turn helix domain-containing protein n=1 Tax=Thelohanellus kitauei TaxID=669202 RepID=A0A0C2JFG2_THEKT|nr:hypothetical protein RF11_02004 [Thelohanellus kitauei]